MTPDEAEEYTQSLGQITGGLWRQIAWAEQQGIPAALGLNLRQWVGDRLGGYVRLEVPERREAVAELAEEGMSQRGIADVVGVSPSTVNHDLKPVQNRTPEPEDPQVSAPGEDGSVQNRTPEPDARVSDWLESDQGLQDAQYLAAFSRTVKNSDDWMEFDPERIGRIGSDLTMRVLEDLPGRAERFLAKAKAARSGLTLLDGGATR
jgi:hypothetical protein